MTVIAWDGKTLAADKRSSKSWGAHDTVTKIHRCGNALIGLAGDQPLADRLAVWFLAGAAAADFPTSIDKDVTATLVVIDSSGPREFSAGPYPMRHESPFCAWGIGRDAANAAMHCGKTAREAVEIACLLITSCGNGIDTLEL